MSEAENVIEVASHHEGASDVGMGTFVLALTLGIACRACFSKWTRLPYTCLVLLLGLLYGFLLYTEVSRTGPDLVSLSADLWINISPEAILTIILPILIFGSSFATDLHLFLQQLTPILTLAGPAVLINTAILGITIKYVLPYGWDWPTSFMVSSILSATDPVAVVAILKELGVAESLSTLIDGESLLNDGVAIVLYSIFSRLAVHEETFSPMGTFKEALVLCLGGPAIGVGVGIVSSAVLGFLLNDPASEITVTIIAGYGSYLLAELAEASGVLSMVGAGLYLSYHGLGRISARVTESLHSFWEMAEWLANTLIFFLSGLIMAEKALVSSTVRGVDWAYLLLLYVILNVTRAFGVAVCFPVLARGPYGISWRQAMLLSWGGLRGAVSLTLSIAVSQVEGIPEETRARISFLIAGIVLLTILINGTTCKPLLNRLGLNSPSEAERELFIRATNVVEGGLEKALRELKHDKYLGDADWNIVFRYLPVPTAQVYWHRVQAGHIKLNEEELAFIGAYVQGGVEDRMLTNKMSAQETAGLGIPAAPTPPKRLSPAVTWMTSLGRWLRGGHWSLIPGSKYEELPPRVRNRWRRYTMQYNDLEEVLHGDKLMVIREATYERLANPLVLPEEDGEDEEEEVVVDGGTGKAIDVHELNVAAMMDDYEEEGGGKVKGKKKQQQHKTTAVATSPSLAASPVTAFVVPPVPRAKSFTVAVTANQPRLHTGPMTATPAVLGPSITEEGEEEECGDGEVVEGGKAKGKGKGHHTLSFAQSLAEARLRLMTILKHVYWGSFQSGLLSPNGIRAFDSNMALLVLTPHKELDEWTALETRVLLPLRTVQESQRWRGLPLVGRLVQTMLFNRLAFFFELAMVFIEAHSNVDLEGLFGAGPMAQQLAREVDAEVLRAKAALKEFLPVFPDIINSVKTEIAARFLLNKYRSLLEHAVESGSLEQKEFDTGIKAVDASMVKLYDHTHSEIAAPRPVLLNNLSFLRFLSQEDKLRLFGPSSTLCRDVYVRSETTFMSKGATDLKGWYVIVRGSVLSGYGDGGEEGGEAMEEEESILQNGAILGFIESLLQSPTQPVPHSYTAASYVHLLYFDRAAILQEAERYPALARSLWWVLAAFELRRNEALGLQSCSMNQLGTLLAEEKLLCVPMHGNVNGVEGATARRGGGRGGMNNMSGGGSGEGVELTHSSSNAGRTIFKNGSIGAALRSAMSSSSLAAMSQQGESDGGDGVVEIKHTLSGLAFMGGSRGGGGGGHQVLESDGNCHLVLLTGRAECGEEEVGGSEEKHLHVAPPVLVVPFLPEGRWRLSRGTVAFYLNEDHCQALVQPPASHAAQSGGGDAAGGAASFAPMLYRFTSMVGPKAFKTAPGGSGPLLIYPMAMREASQKQAHMPQPAGDVARGAHKAPRVAGGVSWGGKEGEEEEEEEEDEEDEGSDGSDEAAVGAMLRQRMSQKVASRRWL